MMMKTILVTGATGFTGSHILEAFEKEDDIRLIAACRNKERLIKSFKGEVREGDLRDEDYLRNLLKGVDVVCHAASWSSLWGNTKNSRELFLEPCLKLVDECCKQGVKKFVNISSTSAAAPDQSNDPMARGIERKLWPHLVNVVAIEDYLRSCASNAFTVVNMRLGIFAGKRYGLGVLPILLPRLKTHLVPWVGGGKTSMPIIDGRDIGQAIKLAATTEGLSGYEGFNIVGPEQPTVKEVIEYIHTDFGYPKPHFGVPFFLAYPFAWLMEKLNPIVPWEPLITRSIIHLLEEVAVDNRHAEKRLGYHPVVHWKDAVRSQIREMDVRQIRPMRMVQPVI